MEKAEEARGALEVSCGELRSESARLQEQVKGLEADVARMAQVEAELVEVRQKQEEA